MQHRGHEMYHRYFFFRYDALQVGAVGLAPRSGKYQPGPCHQRPQELPHRYVETETCLLQYAVPAAQLKVFLRPV